VPDIINYGERGVIITEDLDKDAKAIANLITNQESYNNKIIQASNWSRNFTIDKFKEEIKELLRK
jgi:glycosyltransferase involved in cell wall biosynthesis